MTLKEKLLKRANNGQPEFYQVVALIEIRESLDRYIKHRIESDKTLEGILRDIYSAVQESGP